jgi:hypothetical protein
MAAGSTPGSPTPLDQPRAELDHSIAMCGSGCLLGLSLRFPFVLLGKLFASMSADQQALLPRAFALAVDDLGERGSPKGRGIALFAEGTNLAALISRLDQLSTYLQAPVHYATAAVGRTPALTFSLGEELGNTSAGPPPRAALVDLFVDLTLFPREVMDKMEESMLPRVDTFQARLALEGPALVGQLAFRPRAIGRQPLPPLPRFDDLWPLASRPATAAERCQANAIDTLSSALRLMGAADPSQKVSLLANARRAAESSIACMRNSADLAAEARELEATMQALEARFVRAGR